MNADGVRDPGNDQFGETCSEPGHVHGCPGMAGGDHELIRDAVREVLDLDGPDPSWFEDEEGYVRAPLNYENREGDPAFNGAFDKW
jgi:hypothetical protein